ncbi:PQQ-binding-like beta-propeller repeat protein [Streptomyces sp. NPDC056004]|uniref:outer membrane protein assembly factor BamB family protein n=1 Tax=Streptomyces sp. NPDC056004 TaxID=3345677 RepID=UPI0035DE8B14
MSRNCCVQAGWTALGAIVLLGCSGVDQSTERPNEKPSRVSRPSTNATSAPLRSHEPVTRFAAQELVLPPGAVTLDGGTAWVTAEDGLVAVDVATGQHSYARPKGQRPSTMPKLGPPVVADVRGTRLATTVMPVEMPRTGTHRTRYAIEVLAADANTGKQAWSAQVPLDDSMGFTKSVDLKIAAVDNGIAIVVDGSDLMAIDLTTRKVLWSKTTVGVEAVIAVHDGVIAAVDQSELLEKRVYGLRVTDGKQVWTHNEGDSTVLSAGPRHLLITLGSDLAAHDTKLVDIGTGHLTATPDVATVPDLCSHDGRTTIVCGKFKAGQNGVFALDAESGKKLWELPTSDRNAPRFHSAWHGVVYTSLNSEGLMLDARTGQDRPTPLPQAPDLVNGFAGVFIQDDETGLGSEPQATAHRTSG